MSATHDTKRRANAAVTALGVAMVVSGMGIFLYPPLANWYNTTNSSLAIEGYNREVELRTDEERRAMRAAATAYNESLAEQTLGLGGTIGVAAGTQEEHALYEDTLDVDGLGLIGYIDIPKIGVYLPIRHGTGESVLQAGVGHLEGSSLPVGGESTHAVLTGHTGMPSARLFTGLDGLEVGDTFELGVLGRTLTYEVCEVRVVLPAELDTLRIEEGEDLCTLLTCTPYGINSHRLLVTGRRTRATGEGDEATGWWLDEGFKRWLYLQPAIIGVAAGIHWHRRRRRARMEKEAMEPQERRST